MLEPAQVVTELYRQFSRYELNGELGVCVCNVCCSEAEKAALIATPVRRISCALMSEYVDAVFGGPDEHVKHFLPRQFELILAGEIPCSLGLDAALCRLRPREWRAKWPPPEARAVQRGFDAMATAAMVEDSPLVAKAQENLVGVIYCALNAGAQIGPLFVAASAATTPFATLEIARAITSWRGKLIDESCGAADGLFGSDEAWGEENAAVRAWLRDPALKERLEAAFWATEDHEEQQILSDAVWVMSD